MRICPVCNAFETINNQCSNCDEFMVDEGKLSDFFDDYSPYMEIEIMRREDGFPNNFKEAQCVHLLQCPKCGRQETVMIQE
ncbi:hypothetical protein [Bacillus andreraoultii]|uniref:hypothetical protein n=1 Tax=Bacillus andreraoultii TaxID=1499685 RepID=UPI0005396410|nr:hypothetical protein [Bacillus andreraoultii]